MKKVLYMFLGAVLGGVTGSLIALLLTPMSGDEMRLGMKDYSRQIQFEVEKAAAQRRAELERELAELRREVITE